MSTSARLILIMILTSWATMSPALELTHTDFDIFNFADVVDTEDGTSDLIGYNRGPVNVLNTSASQRAAGDYDYVEWQHDFDLDPAADFITGGTIVITVRDDETGDIVPMEMEFAFAESEDGQSFSGEIDDGKYTTGVDVAALEDGTFEVRIESRFGDFAILDSKLTITYVIPEPNTLALLGIALLILFLMIRRRRKATESKPPAQPVCT